MVSPPVHVSVCPSPALGLGWFGHRSVAPPAAPVCWALLGSLLRRSVALDWCHTMRHRRCGEVVCGIADGDIAHKLMRGVILLRRRSSVTPLICLCAISPSAAPQR